MIGYLSFAVILALTMFGCGEVDESKSNNDSSQTAKSVVREVMNTSQEITKQSSKKKEPSESQIEEHVEEVKDIADQTAKAANKAQTTAVTIKIIKEKAVDHVNERAVPQTIVLETDFGNVNFSHALHADRYNCDICHGEGVPGLFGLDKEKAHPLCKGCHNKEGAGPSGCKECHEQS